MFVHDATSDTEWLCWSSKTCIIELPPFIFGVRHPASIISPFNNPPAFAVTSTAAFYSSSIALIPLITTRNNFSVLPIRTALKRRFATLNSRLGSDRYAIGWMEELKPTYLYAAPHIY